VAGDDDWHPAGELCALRWPDVRFEERDLLVARSYVQRGRHRKQKDTKTHQSRRIALDAETTAVLAEHLERCRARAGTGGGELVVDGYVFSLLPDGNEPLVPDSVSQRFRRLAKRVGVPTHLHEFRHYSATQLIAAGVDLRTVAGRLGHGGGTMTLRVYSHWVAASDQRAAEQLGSSVPRPGSGPPFAGQQ
jgi:integrase